MATESNGTDRTSSRVELTLSFQDMTWGDLRSLLRLAGHMEDGEPVEYDTRLADQYGSEFGLDGILLRGVELP